jgi:hypothetical protein
MIRDNVGGRQHVFLDAYKMDWGEARGEAAKQAPRARSAIVRRTVSRAKRFVARSANSHKTLWNARRPAKVRRHFLQESIRTCCRSSKRPDGRSG